MTTRPSQAVPKLYNEQDISIGKWNLANLCLRNGSFILDYFSPISPFSSKMTDVVKRVLEYGTTWAHVQNQIEVFKAIPNSESSIDKVLAHPIWHIFGLWSPTVNAINKTASLVGLARNCFSKIASYWKSTPKKDLKEMAIGTALHTFNLACQTEKTITAVSGPLSQLSSRFSEKYTQFTDWVSDTSSRLTSWVGNMPSRFTSWVDRTFYPTLQNYESYSWHKPTNTSKCSKFPDNLHELSLAERLNRNFNIHSRCDAAKVLNLKEDAPCATYVEALEEAKKKLDKDKDVCRTVKKCTPKEKIDNLGASFHLMDLTLLGHHCPDFRPKTKKT